MVHLQCLHMMALIRLERYIFLLHLCGLHMLQQQQCMMPICSHPSCLGLAYTVYMWSQKPEQLWVQRVSGRGLEWPHGPSQPVSL